MKYLVTIEGKIYEVEINTQGEISLDGQILELDFQPVADQPVYSLILNGRSYQANLYLTDQGYEVHLRGRLYKATVMDERQRFLRQASGVRAIQSGEYHLRAPMPGLIVEVPVKDDQRVEIGDNLVILESMKMQNELRSPRSGIVRRIQVKAGDNVDQKQILLTLE